MTVQPGRSFAATVSVVCGASQSTAWAEHSVRRFARPPITTCGTGYFIIHSYIVNKKQLTHIRLTNWYFFCNFARQFVKSQVCNKEGRTPRREGDFCEDKAFYSWNVAPVSSRTKRVRCASKHGQCLGADSPETGSYLCKLPQYREAGSEGSGISLLEMPFQCQRKICRGRRQEV